MQGTGGGPDAAAVPSVPARRTTIQSIMRNAQTFLEANEAITQQELAQLQQKVNAQQIELGEKRLALTAANCAALTSKKISEEMVICILFVACCLWCADCSDLRRPNRCSKCKRSCCWCKVLLVQ